MCWHGKITDRKIANEDIKCWKMVINLRKEPFFRPFYRYTNCDMIYEVGNTYQSSIIKEKPRLVQKVIMVDICVGLHCYSSHISFKKMEGGYKVSNGDFFVSSTYSNYKTATLLECTIPKGTVYYENGNGEIVTEKLKINRIVKFDKLCAG